jgi:hypothetical protein
MIEIFEANSQFDFSSWKLRYPLHLPGGNSFCKLASGADRKSLYIETPVCTTKNGFSRNSQKKMSCDLNFTALEHQDFLKFTDSLMECFQSEILKHSSLGNNEEKTHSKEIGHDIWFQNDFDEEDIYDVFIPILKTSAGGQVFTMRVSVPLSSSATDLSSSTTNRNLHPAIKVYDENENDIPLDAVTSNTHVIAILEIKGIKCTSRNFTVELVLKQMMVMNPSSALDTDCLLVSRAKTDSPAQSSPIHDNHDDHDDPDRTEIDNTEEIENAVPLKTSFSEDVDVFNVPSREDSIKEQSHLPDAVCHDDEDEDGDELKPPIIITQEAPGSDSSIDIGIEDIQDLSIDGENIELAEIQDIGDSNIELAEIQDIGDSNIELAEIQDISIELDETKEIGDRKIELAEIQDIVDSTVADTKTEKGIENLQDPKSIGISNEGENTRKTDPRISTDLKTSLLRDHHTESVKPALRKVSIQSNPPELETPSTTEIQKKKRNAFAASSTKKNIHGTKDVLDNYFRQNKIKNRQENRDPPSFSKKSQLQSKSKSNKPILHLKNKPMSSISMGGGGRPPNLEIIDI